MASVLYRDTKVGSAVLFAPAQITSSSQSTVTAVLVTPSSATVAGGGTVDFDWVVLGTNNPSQGATLSTSLGQIDSNGVLTAPAAISTVQNGTVTVTSTQDSRKSGTAAFTVSVAGAASAYPQLNLYTIMRSTPVNLSVTMGGAINLNGKLL